MLPPELIQFTYHSVGRLAPALLAAVIAVYLWARSRQDRGAFWLGLYFTFLSIFNLGYIVGYSVDAPSGGFGWHLACAIAFAGAARLQLAYVLPAPTGSGYERERRVVLILSMCAATGALIEYTWHVGTKFHFGFALHAYGARYSSPWVPLVGALGFFGGILVAVRRLRREWRVFRKSAGAPAGFTRNLRALWGGSAAVRIMFWLALITLLELTLTGVYFLGYSRIIGNATLAGLMNLGILFIFSAYALVYSSSPAGRAGFTPRLVCVTMVTVLTLLTLTGRVFQERALDALRTELAARAGPVALAAPGSEVDSATPVARVARLPAATFYDQRFAFYQTASDRFAAVRVADGYLVYRYAYFRARVDEFVRPLVLSLLLATLVCVLVLPVLFRASLVRPLRDLLEDLGREHSGMPGAPDNSDEFTRLRHSFERMTELLRAARRDLPDYSPHIEELARLSTEDVGRIMLGDRVLIYRSAALRRVIESVERARQYRFPVLITGETGAGKELIARMIHDASPDEADGANPGVAPRAAGGAFVAVNCAALPESLWESEIFGHRKGAFTDARSDRAGRIVEAGGGTMFFDEVGEMPLAIQAKMLRLLQEGEFTPIGHVGAPLMARCRFVFATNRDLDELVRLKLFREDLVYRMRVFPIQLPALRERPEDIPFLFRYFVERFAGEYQLPIPEIEPALMRALLAYAWPGNIREMENAVIRAMAHGPGDRLGLEHFPDVARRSERAGLAEVAGGPAADGTIDFEEQTRRFARSLLEQALRRAGGNKTRAAELLGLKRTTLRYRLKELGLDADS